MIQNLTEILNLSLVWPASAVTCTSNGCCVEECQDQMNISLITASQMGPSVADRQPRWEHLKCLICFSGEKPGDLCSRSLSFRMARLEAVCSSPRLFAAGGCLQRGDAQRPECLNSTAGVYLQHTLDNQSLWTRLVEAALLTNLYFVFT